MPVPHVAIIGRANVGKSTLFNKIIKKRSAIVNDTPGVTRDRIYSRAEWYGKTFMIIDTGGIDLKGEDSIELQVMEQGDLALDQGDVILLVVDSRQGLTPFDRDVVEKIRKSGKPLFLAVNKVDDLRQEDSIHEFSKLGVEKMYPISAEHGNGISGLMEDVVEGFSESPVVEEAQEGIKIAVIGKPNVGKSSLINKLLKSERCIVSDIPGTTRDAIDTSVEYDNKNYLLVDTAGIRRKGKTRKVLEKFGVIMALKAMERCDIVVLVLDGSEEVSDQDAAIAGYAFERGRGFIFAVNKWDLVDPKEVSRDFIEERIRRKLKFMDFAPIITLSAKTGQGLGRFFPEVEEVYQQYSKRITTSKLNECIEAAIRKNPMSAYRGKTLRLFYSTQVKSCPPTFKCFINYPEGVHFSYRRFLVNSLRKTFDFSGTPVRLTFASRHSKN